MQRSDPGQVGFAVLDQPVSTADTTAFGILSQFIKPDGIAIMVKNTNKYVEIQQKSKWRLVTRAEFCTWIGTVIDLGLYRVSRSRDCWKQDVTLPKYPFTKYMSRNSFNQIRCCLHVADPVSEGPGWHSKMEPLASRVKAKCELLYVRSSKVSVDEMMVRFSERSKHTVRMKNKPISEIYKITALCGKGYWRTFEFLSRVEKTKVAVLPGVNNTGIWVVHMCRKLPISKFKFDIYMDNYFSSIPLFSYLRTVGIGACDTVKFLYIVNVVCKLVSSFRSILIVHSSSSLGMMHRSL